MLELYQVHERFHKVDYMHWLEHHYLHLQVPKALMEPSGFPCQPFFLWTWILMLETFPL
uniref:Uncharacterized protein n=1 Tax=Rhizophora mucronata TaxID=61149 RepID=A0A2P2IQZ5_RHIMU